MLIAIGKYYNLCVHELSEIRELNLDMGNSWPPHSLNKSVFCVCVRVRACTCMYVCVYVCVCVCVLGGGGGGGGVTNTIIHTIPYFGSKCMRKSVVAGSQCIRYTHLLSITTFTCKSVVQYTPTSK